MFIEKVKTVMTREKGPYVCWRKKNPDTTKGFI